jgi:hypothetical protein
MNAIIKPRPVQWRMLTEGALVWAPFGNHGWRAATVVGLGKNRSDRTVVHLVFETGGQGRRIAGDLYWRKPELKGKDKPKPRAESLMDIISAAAVEALEHARDPDSGVQELNRELGMDIQVRPRRILH